MIKKIISLIVPPNSYNLLILGFLLCSQGPAENLCDPALLQAVAKRAAEACANYKACANNTAKPQHWVEVWGDDFKYNGPVDPSKWKFELGGTGWGNSEDQCFTNNQANAFVSEGMLHIKAQLAKYEDAIGNPEHACGHKRFTSARLNSAKSFTYGRFVIRAKLPKARGSWPAAWLLANKQTYGDCFWPCNGEIDILESVTNEDPHANHVSVHSKAHNFMNGENQTALKKVDKDEDQFHNYIVEWYPDHLDFFIDDEKAPYYTYRPKVTKDNWKEWPFNRDFHIVLNHTVGGFWGRIAPGIKESDYPSEYQIQSVKVYRTTDPKDCEGAN